MKESIRSTLKTKAPSGPANHLGAGEILFVYRSLHLSASGKSGQVDWERFGEREWGQFLQLAHPDREGVGPLLYRHFESQGWPGQMPREVRSQLRSYYYNTMANNSIRYNVLKRVLIAFDEAEIPVVLLKGAALALLLYEDIGLRPMGDLDILIHPADVRRAFDVLRDQCFRLYKTTSQAVFIGDVGIPVMIELHWGIFWRGATRKPARMDWFWERTTTVVDPAFGSRLVLTPDAHLLFIAAHQYLQHKDYGKRLIWLQDMKRLCDKHPGLVGELDGDPAVTEFGWEHALNGLKTLLDDADRPLEPGAGGLGQMGWKQKDPDTDTTRIFASLSVLDWRMRLRMFLRILLPAPAYIQSRYNLRSRRLLPVFYLVRGFEIFRRMLFGRMELPDASP